MADGRRALHAGQKMAEEALLGALEGAQRGRLGVPVQRVLALDDAGGLERLLDVGVDDLERAGIGVVDAPLLRRERMFEDVDLDPVIGQCPCLVEAERLQIAGDHLHRSDPAGLHGGDELGALLERRLSGRPQAEPPGIGKARNGGRAGGRDVGDARVRQRVLQAQAGAALLGGLGLAALGLRPRRVGHGVGLVEDDHAVEAVAVLLVERAGKPLDDLLQPRRLPLAGRRAQRGVGRKEDAGVEGDLHPLPEIAERDDVALQPAQRGPVAARVLQQLVGLREPEGLLPAAQAVVEDDGGDLAALAAAGAVAQHPAPAEAHRLRQGLAFRGDEGGVDLLLVPVIVELAAVNGLPLGADAVFGRQVPGMGLGRQDDALKLGVGQQALGDHALRQHRPICRHGMRHGRHGGGLDQRRRMRDRARHPDGARPPRRVGAGVVGRGIGRGIDRAALDGELGYRPPVMGLPRLERGYWLGAAARRRLRRNRLAEQVAGGAGRDRRGRDRLALRHPGNDGIQQLGGVGGSGGPVQLDGGSGAPLQHGEAGVEAGAAAGIGAPVDRHGEHASGRGIETADGVAQHAMGRGDRHQPAARRQHRDGRADMAQVGVVPAAVDPRRRREGRVHEHDGRPDAAQPVGDGLGVERRHDRLRKQPG